LDHALCRFLCWFRLIDKWSRSRTDKWSGSGTDKWGSTLIAWLLLFLILYWFNGPLYNSFLLLISHFLLLQLILLFLLFLSLLLQSCLLINFCILFLLFFLLFVYLSLSFQQSDLSFLSFYLRTGDLIVLFWSCWCWWSWLRVDKWSWRSIGEWSRRSFDEWSR
jgi:hypothetical protein